MIKRFIMTPAPHVLHRDSTRSIMRDVIIALVPAVIAGFIFFGWQAMGVLFMSTASCVVFEALYQRVCKKQVTVGDLSAVVTGLILGLNLPANSPAWMVVLGSAFAIVLVKQLFGGLGHNFCNPALAARIMLTVSFAVVIGQAVPTRFMQAEAEAAAAARASYGIVQTDTESGTMPDADSSATPDTDSSATPDTDSSATPDGASSATPDGASSATPDAESSATPDALSSATPLAMLKRNAGDEIPSLWTLFAGNHAGVIGETSELALLLGFAYMLWRRVVDGRITLSYLGSMFILTWLLGNPGFSLLVPLRHLLSGGLMLGAVFMATDYVTTPISKLGRVVFGAGCGLLTAIFRIYSQMPEGVSYAIMLMTLVTPLIDKALKPKMFAEVKKADA